MKPQEVPPLLQQILHFCSNGDFLNLFCTLQKYFDDKYLIDQNNEENNEFKIGSVYIYNLFLIKINICILSTKYLVLINLVVLHF